MTENELKIHAKKKELLRMLTDIHKEIVFGDLKDERFREMIRESLKNLYLLLLHVTHLKLIEKLEH